MSRYRRASDAITTSTRWYHGTSVPATSMRFAATDVLRQALESRGVRGDCLLDAIDLAGELIDAGAEISSSGMVTLYHRTNPASAEEIARTGKMVSKEDRLFFGTSHTGQIDGYGDAVIRVHMPLEKLELSDWFQDEAHVTVRSGRPGTLTPVRAEVVASKTRLKVDGGRKASLRTASWWSQDMLNHMLDRLDLGDRDAYLFNALCERFLGSTDTDYLQDMCYWAASFLGEACQELGVPMRVATGMYTPEDNAFGHAWLEDAHRTPFDITAIAHAVHRRETRSGDVTGVAMVCPACGNVEMDCACDAPPEPVERTKRFPDDDEMIDAGYECAERDQYPEWVPRFVGPDRYDGISGDAAEENAKQLGFDEEQAKDAREMAQKVMAADGGRRAARRAAVGVESDIEAIATATRRRLGVDHEVEDGEVPRALCLEFARGLVDELVRRGYSAGVTQGTFEVDWPDEDAYDEWDSTDFEDEAGELADEGTTGGQETMEQAMHFPLHYWVRVTAKDSEPIGPVYADITADQFDDECEEPFDPVWIWTGDTDRHHVQRHNFNRAVFPQASRYHRTIRTVAGDDTEYVYHGTSLTQLNAIRAAGWMARDLYLVDYQEKSIDQQAQRDAAEPVVQAMSRYHCASAILDVRTSARKVRPISGIYGPKVKGVVGGLRDRLLQFSLLLLHRLVEERKFAVILAEISEGRDIHMTESPEIEDPDDESKGKSIVAWPADKLERIKSRHRVRMAKTAGMDRELDVISASFIRAEPWLDTALPIYAVHMKYLDDISKDQYSPERKAEDRDESFLRKDFDMKAPGMKWDKQDLFVGRPEANSWSLRHMANIYKHGATPRSLKPMVMNRGSHGSAALLDSRMDEMRSKSTDSWSVALSEDESGEYPAFLDAARNLLRACKVALTDDEKLLAMEWEKIDNIVRGGLLKSGGKKKGPRKPRKGPKKKRWDWNEFIGLKEKDPEERLQRQIHRYKRDKRGRFAK